MPTFCAAADGVHRRPHHPQQRKVGREKVVAPVELPDAVFGFKPTGSDPSMISDVFIRYIDVFIRVVLYTAGDPADSAAKTQS